MRTPNSELRTPNPDATSPRKSSGTCHEDQESGSAPGCTPWQHVVVPSFQQRAGQRTGQRTGQLRRNAFVWHWNHGGDQPTAARLWQVNSPVSFVIRNDPERAIWLSSA